MLFAALAPLALASLTSQDVAEIELKNEHPSEFSISITSGWGEQLAGTAIDWRGDSWSTRAERGSGLLIDDSLSGTGPLQDIDLVTDDSGRVLGCAYNSTSQSLEFHSKELDGTLSVVEVDNSANVGRGCSVAVDHNNRVRIAYLDVDSQSVKIAREAAPTPFPDDDWLIRTLVDDSVIVTPVAIDVYSNGTEAVAYRDNIDGSLHLTRFTGSWWYHTPMVSVGAAPDFVLNIDVNDVLHLTYLNEISNRVTVISLDGNNRSTSVVDSGVGLGQPLGHHLDELGRAQLVYGADNGTSLSLVRDLSGRDDGRLHPDAFASLSGTQDTGFGSSVIGDTDYDGDGYSDLIVSEPDASNSTGAVHLWYGSSDPPSGAADLILTGANEGARFGATIAKIGDLNGDGYPELLIGAPGEEDSSGNSTGAVHLFRGHPTGLQTTSAWTRTGSTDGELYGARVANAGDVNGDGVDDLLITAHGTGDSSNGEGRVDLHLGAATIGGVNWTVSGSTSGLILGWQVLGVGDANNDGYDDVAISGCKDWADLSTYGRVEVFAGSPTGLSASPARAWSMNQQWTQFGMILSSLGDMNGDGYDDFAVSEPQNASGPKIWVFQGSSSGYASAPTFVITNTNTGSVLGSAMTNVGDINDDGIPEILVGSKGSGNSGGDVTLYQGRNDSLGPVMMSWSGIQGQHHGSVLAIGGDMDRDGSHEFILATPYASGDGSLLGEVRLIETRDWELNSLPLNGVATDLDLEVDAQGRTHILVTVDGVHIHMERPNEALSSGAAWDNSVFWDESVGGPASSALAVSPAGQPNLMLGTSSVTQHLSKVGGVFVGRNAVTSVNTAGFSSVALDSNGYHHVTFTSGGTSVLYLGQDGAGSSSSLVSSGVSISAPTRTLVNFSGEPILLWRDDSTSTIMIAMQNGSSWQSANLAENSTGARFDAVIFANDSIALLYTSSGSGLNVEWLEYANGSYLSGANVTMIDAVNASLGALVDLAWSAGGGLDVVTSSAGNASWLRIDAAMNVSEVQMIANATGQPHLYIDVGLTTLLLAQQGNNNQTSRRISASGMVDWQVNLDVDWDNTAIVAGPQSQSGSQSGSPSLLASRASDGIFSVHEIGDEMDTPVELAGLAVFGSISAAMDSDGNLHISTHKSSGQDLHLLIRLYDGDRDFIPAHLDDLDEFGGQWNDQDGDGYGDRADGPQPDSCVTTSGTSYFLMYGCGDLDGDGYSNAIDDCGDDGYSFRDRLGCEDIDADGWSGMGDDWPYGDRWPTNWMQSMDTDGDGLGDNHGPDCCINPNDDPDWFPLDPRQWIDADGDGVGDNSSDPNGDQCPWEWGASQYDRRGCLDSDGDGWSDPRSPSTEDPDGWQYIRSECVNNGTFCADKWPWAADDSSTSNPCGTRCNEQWGDSDGDGWGDNSTPGAWRRDAFPLDPTQWNDTDEDGYGDNAEGNNGDDCMIRWGNSSIDKLGCPDTDGDGHSDDYTYATNSTTGLRENEQGDALPLDPDQWRDRDGDGFGENPVGDWDRCISVFGYLNGAPGPGCPLPEGDADNDGVGDSTDSCPDTPAFESVDLFGCAESQKDDDLDNVNNAIDLCPDTVFNETVNENGCSDAQLNLDSDDDGVSNVFDLCPNTDVANETADENGCAPSQRDADDDGVSDADDLCPDTTAGAAVDVYGCVDATADSDNDGWTDDVDAFPLEPTQHLDSDGDGYGDNQTMSAVNSDACVSVNGPSHFDRNGCPDTDGDGWSDPDTDWPACVNGARGPIGNGLADWLYNDPTQNCDRDGDGFGDNQDGTNGDYCPNTAGIEDGDSGDGCPGEIVIPWEELDDDNDKVKNGIDDCLGTHWTQVDDVDLNGCSPSQLLEQQPDDKGGSLPSLWMIIGGIGLLVLLGIIVLVVMRMRSGGIDWDEVEDDLYDEGGDDDYSDPYSSATSPLGASTAMGTSPTRTLGPSDGSDSFGGPREEIERETLGTPGARPGGSRVSSGQRGQGPPTGGAMTDGAASFSMTSDSPASSVSSPSSRTSRAPGPPTPSRRPGSQKTEAKPAADKPQRKTRRTAGAGSVGKEVRTRKTGSAGLADDAPAQRKVRRTADAESEQAPIRKTRRTRRVKSADEEVDSTGRLDERADLGDRDGPVRKTRKTGKVRRSKVGDVWSTVFTDDQRAGFNSAVKVAKERLIVGDSDRVVLGKLQAEGWDVKQSKHILGHAKE